MRLETSLALALEVLTACRTIHCPHHCRLSGHTEHHPYLCHKKLLAIPTQARSSFPPASGLFALPPPLRTSAPKRFLLSKRHTGLSHLVKPHCSKHPCFYLPSDLGELTAGGLAGTGPTPSHQSLKVRDLGSVRLSISEEARESYKEH